MTLSKSNYMLFLKHPAWLWLKKFDKHKLPPIDDNLQAIFDAGHEFESYAEKIFKNTINIGFDIGNFATYKSMPFRTKKALDNGAKTITQGRFEADGLTCIVDVLNRVNNNTFDLIEIKSSSKVKPEHYYDLAFQAIVLEKSGINLRNLSVIHINKEYVRKGTIDPKGITTQTDVTEAVKQLIDITHKQINKALKVLSQKTIPDISLVYANQLNVSGTSWFRDWLDIYKTLKPIACSYNIYDLCSPSAKLLTNLENRGISKIKDMPENLKLNSKQRHQIKATKTNKRLIDKKRIKEFLNTLKYPLYFFDYETLAHVIPAFDGYHPNGAYPFQYSLHILDKPGAKLKRTEYLHTKNSNPMPELIKKLKQDIGNKGTILAWYMLYEKGCNDRMADLYPKHKMFLNSLNTRIKDLMTPFYELWLVDKDFFGSASLKKVLPVITPELSYKDLDIANGLLARRTWTKTVLKEENLDQKNKIMLNLSEYCTLDTFAMVRILEELNKISTT